MTRASQFLLVLIALLVVSLGGADLYQAHLMAKAKPGDADVSRWRERVASYERRNATPSPAVARSLFEYAVVQADLAALAGGEARRDGFILIPLGLLQVAIVVLQGRRRAGMPQPSNAPNTSADAG